MPGPSQPLLEKGAVHVWRADLSAVGKELERPLCAQERIRARRSTNAGKTALRMRSRGVLRALLGRYLGADPSALRFAVGAHGKPKLVGERAISFNLAHSGALALYAVSEAGEVGVDVELRRRQLDAVALAARAFGEDHARRLKLAEPAERQHEFLRLWTRHESELKLRGTGIGAETATDGCEPWIADLEIGADGAGALALARAPSQLRCWVLPRGSLRRSSG